MSDPVALEITVRPGPGPGAPTVVFVHGSLDRGDSFRRVVRRLPDLAAVTYDRRGYEASRSGGIVDLTGHVTDLLDIATTARTTGSGLLVAVGHSFGGDVVIGAALAEPEAFDAIGAYEPPIPWLGFGSGDPGTNDHEPGPPVSRRRPEVAAERFFRSMTGVPAWNRLSQRAKEERRADGPALLADMRSLQSDDPPFDVTDLDVPAVFGTGGPASAPHHRRGVHWLAAHVPRAQLFEITAARHGAHLSHPDHFATLTRHVVRQAGTRPSLSHRRS